MTIFSCAAHEPHCKSSPQGSRQEAQDFQGKKQGVNHQNGKAKRALTEFENNPAAKEAAALMEEWLPSAAQLKRLTAKEVEVLAREIMNTPRAEFGGQRCATRGTSSPTTLTTHPHSPCLPAPP